MNPRVEDRFIELGRTFHELRAVGKGNGDADALARFFDANSLGWQKLLLEHRVVILSEAGSGKTEEIRNIARKLRSDGKFAFFLRLEHVVNDFGEAFEEGTSDEFLQWMRSSGEGWLLLDSIDEARLRSPGDFERALRKVSSRIGRVMQRAHIIITGRTSAWRPKTDLELCKNQFPLSTSVRAATDIEADKACDPVAIVIKEEPEGKKQPFLIVALDDLRPDQLRRFAEGKGVEDIDGLLDAIERADAYMFTARPQDLSEVIEFWEDHKRIGTRLELIRNSITRRLVERDQNRAEVKSMDAIRARTGAVLVAGATTMAQEQNIRVPDGAENREGLPVTRILPNWDEQDCSTLLSRPIFDEAIYGSVRFHHRSVREYLAAEWLADLLARDSSRREIEELFFREQYGLEVIVPTMRPILPWLILLDQGIRDRALRLAPELVFEGGDPAQLPLDTRRQLLAQICTRLATDKTFRSNGDTSAVQRFANPDLADDINTLLAKHGSDDEVSWLLLRMIWQGQLEQCLPTALQFALDRHVPEHTRIAAFRAVAAVGSEMDRAKIRATFLSESRKLNRRWLAELLKMAPSTAETANWLVRALAKALPRAEFEVDGLGEAVWQFVDKAGTNDLLTLSEGMGRLLRHAPIIDHHFCEVSRYYQWLVKPAALAVQRLVEQRHSAALGPISLDILRRVGTIDDRGDFDLRNVPLRLAELVQAWPEMNDAVFWFDVASTRKALKAKNERLDDWWRISIRPSLWAWSIGDIDRLVEFTKSKRLLDDRQIALSLVFHIYQTNGRPAALRRRLLSVAKGTPALESRLAALMRPPPQSEQIKAWKRSERRWRRRSAARASKQAKNNEDWRTYVRENIGKLRDPSVKKPEHVSNAQHYLHYQLESESNTHWRGGNWRSLIPKYGNKVAEAFRDGCVAYWRRNKPRLRSEGAPSNTTYFTTIFGLSGIGIEADETPDWPSMLTEAEAELITRYALFELNGYPGWMRRLYIAFPEAVMRVLLREVRWELANAGSESENLYALYDVSWYGEWMWDRWAPILLAELTKREPTVTKSVPRMLKVLHGSSLADEQIRDLAAAKCGSISCPERLAHWYAAWVGVDPAQAVPQLEAFLDSMPDVLERLDFAMKFVTNLLGGDRSDYPAARNAYRTVPHLKALYLLMHKHIRQRDDIRRANTGAYSPGLRDHAQEARDRLFSLLNEIAGKEAFLALMDISRAHPEPGSRPWFARHARVKAELDVESGSWSLDQFVDFNAHLERTPANNSQLFDLVWMRLLDLKESLERGDSSIASILKSVTSETEMRKYIGDELRKGSNSRFSVPQEEELADATRPDIRIHGNGFDAPVPIELKLADNNWTGPHLFERLENQLCGNYLRDPHSKRGIFALVYRGEKAEWKLPHSRSRVGFDGLVLALQKHWFAISPRFTNVVDLRVLGVDLTVRGRK